MLLHETLDDYWTNYTNTLTTRSIYTARVHIGYTFYGHTWDSSQIHGTFINMDTNLTHISATLCAHFYTWGNSLDEDYWTKHENTHEFDTNLIQLCALNTRTLWWLLDVSLNIRVFTTWNRATWHTNCEITTQNFHDTTFSTRNLKCKEWNHETRFSIIMHARTLFTRNYRRL